MNFSPSNLDEYIGQDKIKKSIRISIDASKKREEPFPHILLHGASGLGKTTLANVIAKEYGVTCTTFLAPVLESVDPIHQALREGEHGHFIFIDEVHALNKKIQESLYTSMTNNVISIDSSYFGSYEEDIQPFTCISATTDLGMLSTPFRERFGFIVPLRKYSNDEIATILSLNTSKLHCSVNQSALNYLANASRKNPRTANRLLSRCYDLATVNDSLVICEETVKETLFNLSIDENGLTSDDYKILQTLIITYDCNPTGLKALALSCDIDEKAVETVYEPLLVDLGLVKRTSRGRVITKEGYTYYAKNNS